MMHPLAIVGLCFSYAERPVLKNITAHFPKGSFTGIIGPNGSGKSTLVKVIARWLSPASGQVWLNGKTTAQLSHQQVARALAVVEQESIHGIDLTVRELVGLGRLPHQSPLQNETAEDKAIIEQALSKAGLSDLQDRLLSKLSGGEKQRARIATALAQNCPVLILDEPTTHLDIRHQMELLTLLRSLAQGGMTIIAVLHDINLAALYCQRILVMAAGELYASGTPAEVLQPRLIEAVYGCQVSVFMHPSASIPQISLIPL
ncbi:MAG: Ferric enterobactin transport ATP-binding protein FepC [Firmicutes bacterium]|nr:Ferric enterobactin transport ATP-binding protein FepC [Bacillota bacterium]